MRPAHLPSVACCEYVRQSVCLSVPSVYVVQYLVIVVCVCGQWYAMVLCAMHQRIFLEEDKMAGG